MPDCNDNHISLEDRLKALITKTVTGEWAICFVEVDACELDAIDCANNVMSIEQILSNCIGTSDCGKPALRIGRTPLAP